jgi:hypothetical protein
MVKAPPYRESTPLTDRLPYRSQGKFYSSSFSEEAEESSSFEETFPTADTLQRQKPLAHLYRASSSHPHQSRWQKLWSHEGHHSHWLHWALLGTTILAGAYIALPVILPLFGVGTAQAVTSSLFICTIPSLATGSGIAGAVSGILGSIPVVGGALANGGLANTLTGAAMVLGGTWLGGRLSENHQKWQQEQLKNGHAPQSFGEKLRYHFDPGVALKAASIGASLFVMIPALFPAFAASTHFMGQLLAGGELGVVIPGADQVGYSIAQTLGTVPGSNMLPAAGIGSAISLLSPHLLGCGLAIASQGAALNHALNQHSTHVQTSAVAATALTSQPGSAIKSPLQPSPMAMHHASRLA